MQNENADEDDDKNFEEQLTMLRGKTPTFCSFYNASVPIGRWTDRQAREVNTVLVVNKTIDHLSMDLEMCLFSSHPCFFLTILSKIQNLEHWMYITVL
jgi:hypothetical protein